MAVAAVRDQYPQRKTEQQDDGVAAVGKLEERDDSADRSYIRLLTRDIEGGRTEHDDLAGIIDSETTMSKLSEKAVADVDVEVDFCPPCGGPTSVEHCSLHIPTIAGCFGCDHGKAIKSHARRRNALCFAVSGKDAMGRPFWGSSPHGLAGNEAWHLSLADSPECVGHRG